MNNIDTVLVTGGSGFIGRHLVGELNADPTIRNIIILDQNPPAFTAPKITFVCLDLRQSLTWTPECPIENIRCVHLAAVCREPGYSWDEYFTGNFLIAKNVAEWASRIGLMHIIFTSTAMVFKAAEKRYAETDLPNPDTAYGISKALAEERFLHWAAERHDNQLHILRAGVVFGKGGGGNFARLYSALRRNLFCYVGKKNTVKSAIYVKDLVRIIVGAISRKLPPDTYHALYDEALTLKAICGAFCKVYGWKRFIPIMPYRMLLGAAMPFELANAVGLKNPIHHRRIEKLFYSTNLSANKLVNAGFTFQFAIEEAIRDWRNDCAPNDLY